MKKLFLILLFTTSCVQAVRDAKITPLKDFRTSDNKKTVLIGGCFDLLHENHIEFLKDSKKIGDYLIVALESDETIIKNKHRYSINSQESRAKILSSIRYVDEIVLLPVLNGYDDYLKMTKKIQPNIIAITDPDPQVINKTKMANLINADVIKINNYNTNKSTSNIMQTIKKTEIENIFINGKITKGLQLARTLGFPTLNMKIQKKQTNQIAEGLHLCIADIKNKDYNAICYYDHLRPDKILEVHILNQNLQNINFLKVRLIEFLRPKIKFNSKDELINKIHQDVLLAQIKFNKL